MPLFTAVKHREYNRTFARVRERKMTIALGILASDGLVLAADTEISSDGGELKGVDSKLIGVSQALEHGIPGRALGLAGAGSLPYFQSLRLDAAIVVMRSLGDDGKDDHRIKHNLELLMTDFHNKHVIPYAKFKHPPEISLLVGTWFNEAGTIWATDKGTVRKAALGYDAIGGGAGYALDLLHGHFHDGPVLMSRDSAALLAAYVMLRVKSTIQGCGQETHIALLSPGAYSFVPRALLTECDRIIEQHYLRYAHEAFYYAIGAIPGAALDHLLQTRLEFDRLRQAIRATTSAKDQI